MNIQRKLIMLCVVGDASINVAIYVATLIELIN
jgi:hypothetical protein